MGKTCGKVPIDKGSGHVKISLDPETDYAFSSLISFKE